MQNALTQLEITAYHEAAHTVVAHVLGKHLGCISLVLAYTQQGELWEGRSDYDPSAGTDVKWINRDLDHYIPYDKLPPPTPDDKYRKLRDDCTITCAGLIAEELLYEQLGKDKKTVQAEGSTGDKKKAEILAREFPPHEQEKELLNAEARARGILSNPVCWNMVEDLSKVLTSAILQGAVQKQVNGSTDWYVFIPSYIYESFAQTLQSSRA